MLAKCKAQLEIDLRNHLVQQDVLEEELDNRLNDALKRPPRIKLGYDDYLAEFTPLPLPHPVADIFASVAENAMHRKLVTKLTKINRWLGMSDDECALYEDLIMKRKSNPDVARYLERLMGPRWLSPRTLHPQDQSI